MTASIDHSELSPIAQRLLKGEVPAQMLSMAAKGVIMGAPPADVVSVLAALCVGSDAALAATARQTLASLAPPLLNGAMDADLQPLVTEVLARSFAGQARVVERLLRLPRLSGDALVTLAENADEAIGELVATNERLLLQHPRAIERLYMNERVRMSTADRLLELAVRNDIKLDIPAYEQAAAAITNETARAAKADPSSADRLYQETRALAAKYADAPTDEDTHVETPEGEEAVKEKFLPLHAKLAQMSISQKIRRAILGTSSERNLLIKDTNKLVAGAAASSPQFTERDAVRIASNRSVHEDVLRIISKNRTFTRGYQIKLALVSNPKTPLPFATGFIPYLRDNDLKSLSKDKNVASNVKTMIRQQLAKKVKKT